MVCSDSNGSDKIGEFAHRSQRGMFYEVESDETQKQQSTNGNGWSLSWSGLVDTIKKTSEQVKEIVVSDIQELAEAGSGIVTSLRSEQQDGVLEEALDTLDGIAEKAEKFTVEGFQKLTGGIGSWFVGTTQTRSFANRTESLIYDAGETKATFLNTFEGDGVRERYLAFKEQFDQIAHAGKIARLLDEQPTIRQFQIELVPLAVSEEEFWVRYYFTISEIELAQQVRAGLADTQEEDFAWSSDEEVSKDLAKSEQVQEEGQQDIHTEVVKEVPVDEVQQVAKEGLVDNNQVVVEDSDVKIQEQIAEALAEDVKSLTVEQKDTGSFSTGLEENVEKPPVVSGSESGNPPEKVDEVKENTEENVNGSFDMVSKPQISPTTLAIIEKEEEEWGGWD